MKLRNITLALALVTGLLAQAKFTTWPDGTAVSDWFNDTKAPRSQSSASSMW